MSAAARLLALLAGLYGAAGVALAAAASHGALANAGPASQMLLAHAPALLAVALGAQAGPLRPGPLLAGGGLIGLGVLLFSGTLMLRAATGWSAFGMAAPTGGTLTILGWLVVGSAAFFRRRQV